MKKLSAGLLLYLFDVNGSLKVLLVHPGGPFWRRKEEGVWSIPKGEYEEDEDALAAAKREFKEEVGNDLPDGDFIPLQPVKIKSGKVITAWALECKEALAFIKSNKFEMEWPPKSGKKQIFPEVDKAEWFLIEDAKAKINSGQMNFLIQLVDNLSSKNKRS